MAGLTAQVAALADAVLSEDAAATARAMHGAPPAASTPAEGGLRCGFRREGEYWALGLGGEVVRLRHLRGFDYIVHLLRRPLHAEEKTERDAGGAA